MAAVGAEEEEEEDLGGSPGPAQEASDDEQPLELQDEPGAGQSNDAASVGTTPDEEDVDNSGTEAVSAPASESCED